MSSTEGRPLVEAWEVRSHAMGHAIYKARGDAAFDAEQTGGTVVPLIAADRLTDEALERALTEMLTDRFNLYGNEPHIAHAVLAALRAHLESA